MISYGDKPTGPFKECKPPPFPEIDQNYVHSIDQEPLIGEQLPPRAKIRRVLKHYDFARDGVTRSVKLPEFTLYFNEKGWFTS